LVEKDIGVAKYLLKHAYKNGNELALEHMINFNLIKNKKELEAEVLIADDDVNSLYALSSVSAFAVG
jgi:hypothetical protein